MIIDFREEPLGKSAEKQVRGPFQYLPLRIQIGNVDLLGYVEETDGEPEDFRWGRLPPIDVAAWGLFSLERAHRTGRYVYELGRHGEYGSALLFKVSGDDM